jgi:hypothetical protein
MNNKLLLKLLQALSLTTASYSFLCFLCKIFLCHSETSILQDVTPSHKAKIVTKRLVERPYFTLIT